METMIEKAIFKKYPFYKNSGVEWLGEIPDQWEVKKLKFLGNIFAGLNGKKGDDFSKEFIAGLKSYIPFTNICNNLKISEEQFHFVKVGEMEKQNRVLKNDILFLMSSEILEDIAKCSIYLGKKEELYLNSFCKGFRISHPNVNSEYVNYLFLSSTYRSYFSLVGRGFTRINLKQEFINDAFCILPSLEEQTAIAQFLDQKTTLIDKAISQKEKQIELLIEHKKIVIHNAVTQGLNPKVKMNDSGIEWVGKIPAHWEVKRAKYLFDEIDDRSKTGNEELLSVSHMTGVTPRSEKNVTMFEAEDYSGSKLCKKDDLVYNIMWAWMGALGVSDRIGIVSPSYAVYRQKNHNTFNTWFLEQLLGDTNYVAHYNRVSTGLHSSRLRFYSNMFFDMKIGFPPREEQDRIVDYLKSVSSKIATAISLKEKEIEKLKEYKATLINSAVTGKIKIC